VSHASIAAPPASATVADVGERALIERIRARVPPPPPSVLVGIGDDAAVVRPERNEVQVVTTDGLVEGVHFEWSLVEAFDVGHKALAVNLSDLAAMGAAPRLALLSLALPAALPMARLDGILDGWFALAAEHCVALIGGNITRSPGPLMIDVTAIGSARPRRVLLRSTARAGDELYVSGSIGGGAAGLGLLRAGRPDAAAADPCIAKYRRPVPRVRLGILLGRNRAARAAVDLSDGLADGVRQLAVSSGLGAIVDAAEVPLAPCARDFFTARGVDPITAAMAGGEDYELLLAAPTRARRALLAVARAAGVPMTRIGHMTADPALVLRRESRDEPLPEGFVHFA
jgi:thiamine-monophosphate kinase